MYKSYARAHLQTLYQIKFLISKNHIGDLYNHIDISLLVFIQAISTPYMVVVLFKDHVEWAGSGARFLLSPTPQFLQLKIQSFHECRVIQLQICLDYGIDFKIYQSDFPLKIGQFKLTQFSILCLIILIIKTMQKLCNIQWQEDCQSEMCNDQWIQLY